MINTKQLKLLYNITKNVTTQKLIFKCNRRNIK